MKTRFILFFILFTALFLASCKKKSEFSKLFSCENKINLSNLEVVDEFTEHFSVRLPENWKTELYSIEGQSGIISADTTKVLSETYKIDFSLVQGSISISEVFKTNLEQVVSDSGLTTLQSGFIVFNNKEGLYNLAKGTSNKIPIEVLQYYIKLNDDEYLLVKSEIFGNTDTKSRICETLFLIDQIEITNKNK